MFQSVSKEVGGDGRAVSFLQVQFLQSSRFVQAADGGNENLLFACFSLKPFMIPTLSAYLWALNLLICLGKNRVMYCMSCFPMVS